MAEGVICLGSGHSGLHISEARDHLRQVLDGSESDAITTGEQGRGDEGGAQQGRGEEFLDAGTA